MRREHALRLLARPKSCSTVALDEGRIDLPCARGPRCPAVPPGVGQELEPPTLRLALFGGARISLGEGQTPPELPIRKAQALLACLALPPGRVHPRDQLAALLWGDVREHQARTSLRQALYVLRRALVPLRPPALRVTPETTVLDPALVEVDVVEFERQVAEGTPDALATSACIAGSCWKASRSVLRGSTTGCFASASASARSHSRRWRSSSPISA